MKIKSVGLKVSLIVALMVTVIITVIVLIVSAQSTVLIEELTKKEAAGANVTLVKEVKKMESDTVMRARMIAYSNEVISAVLADDAGRLKEALTEYSEGIDTVTVCDPQGNVLARAHSDDRTGNIMNQRSVSNAFSSNDGIGSAIERSDITGLSVRGSAVLRDDEGNVIGAVVCGYDLSNPRHVDYIKEYTGSEVTIFDGDTRLMSTIKNETGERVVGTQMTNTDVTDAVLNRRTDFSLQIDLFGGHYYAHYSPLVVDGQAIGMLFTGVCINDALSGLSELITTVLIVGIICGAVCLLLVFIFNIFAVGRPLKKIGAFAEKIKSGDIGVSSNSASTIDVRSSDEVGVLARALEQAYTQLRGYVGEIKDRMQGLADGDLATESVYDFHGDFVLIKDSINDHVRNLNHTMSEINNSSSQVSNGSKQVADGAQTLARGSTEQAAAVEQLSSSISEIAQKTKDNAEKATQAATLANNIKVSAEKGNGQMDEMMSAVREIEQASQSISKVIKAIDDIAFQTNILALNAAVEAARAGQHGKGFAVVAEEVRNLASKSSEAAKETGALIQNSVEKAALGSRIAGDTAASLAEIVSGINESTQIVTEIAQSSEEQAAGIKQINTGIDQVAQVVQQNSATAEESAAASEEMSGQSDMLQQLISQFKLKNGDTARRSLPSTVGSKRITVPGDNGDFGKY